jgi:tetratricopeptide (TPR) repeat protein
MAVNALGILGADRRIEAPLLERAVSLLRIAVQDDPGTQLPWGCVANRPALRCVFARLHAALGNDDLRRAQELAEWLVMQLNPNDNHGLRGTRARLYLAAEQPDRAIALTDRYPEDFAEVSLNRVLALFMGQRRGDALTAFSDAARKHPVALKRDQQIALPGTVEGSGPFSEGASRVMPWKHHRDPATRRTRPRRGRANCRHGCSHAVLFIVARQNLDRERRIR